MSICLTNLKKAVKEFLPEDEASKFYQNLEAHTNHFIKNKLQNKNEALTNAVNKILENEKINNQIRARNIKHTLIAKNNFYDYVNNAQKEKNLDKAEILKDRILGSLKYYKGSSLSTDSLAASYRNFFMNELDSNLTKKNLFYHFDNKETELDVARELFQENSTNNNIARDIASEIKKTKSLAVEKLNIFGANIEERPDHIITQSHDPYKMLRTEHGFMRDIIKRNKIGFTAWQNECRTLWKNFIKPLLDEKTFTDIKTTSEKENFLDSIFNHITTGISLDKEPESLDEIINGKINKPQNMANSLGAERLLHFKDAESLITYNNRYGTQSLKLSLFKMFHSYGNKLALLEHWGVNPKALFNNIKNEIEKSERGNIKNLKQKLNYAQKKFEQLMGSHIPEHSLIATTMSNIRSFAIVSKMGKILINSISDIATSYNVLHEHGINPLASIGNSLLNLVKHKSANEKRILASMFNVMLESTVGSAMTKIGTLDSSLGASNKMVHKFLKYTGIHYWDDSHRIGTATTLSHFLAEHAHLDYENLPSAIKTKLNLYEINKDEWSLFKNNLVVLDGKKYLAPEAARDFTDAQIKNYLKKDNVNHAQIVATKNSLEMKLRTYFMEQSNLAIMKHGLAETMAIKDAGIWGEFLKSISFFKTFTFTLGRRVVARKIINKEYGGLAEFIALSTVMGYCANMLSSISNGVTPDTNINGETFINALVKGGGLALYGDFLFNQYGKFNNDLSSKILGADVGLIGNVASLATKLKDMDKFMASGTKFLKNNIPFVNLWYTRAALNRLVFDRLIELTDSGYEARMENYHRKNNQEFLF